MDLSVVSVTYNDEEVIDEFLDSLRKSELVEDPTLETEIFVVDNDSQDGTVSRLKKSSFVNLIEPGENLGFSKANNLALEKAQGRYILFINPDTSFSRGVFEEMTGFLENKEEVGAATCKVLLPDGKLDPNTRRAFPSLWAAFLHFSSLGSFLKETPLYAPYYIDDPSVDETHEIPACGGAFIMVRRDVLEKVGVWDEDFFLYGEDLDLCFRINEAGYKIMYYPKVSITHYGGVSTGIKKSGAKKSKADRAQRLKMAKYSINAMRLFYNKHLAKEHNFLYNAVANLGFNALYILRVFLFGVRS